MSERWIPFLQSVAQSVGTAVAGAARGLTVVTTGAITQIYHHRWPLAASVAITAAAYGLYRYPPLTRVDRGEALIRSNTLLGTQTEFHEGSALVIPGLHRLRRYPLRDQVFSPKALARADGSAPIQSVEGLSLGVDLSVRYALDDEQLLAVSARLPDQLGTEVIEPAVNGVIYPIFTRYTVKEIFSTKREEIRLAIEAELKPKLAADGIVLKAVLIGKVDLPADYRAGMEKLLAEELETEKMRYTLELKDKAVKQSELEAEAEKVRREKEAEAAGSEQIIAAKAQEEAMKHVLPFKQKQIEQRQLEAEADKLSRIKTAEGLAEARRIEAAGEADYRRKLADAEVYRQEHLGEVASAQLERDGALLSKHPLLIQKTMADKLSDKVQVIIAPTPASGGFIGSALLGQATNHLASRGSGESATNAVATGSIIGSDAMPADGTEAQ